MFLPFSHIPFKLAVLFHTKIFIKMPEDAKNLHPQAFCYKLKQYSSAMKAPTNEQTKKPTAEIKNADASAKVPTARPWASLCGCGLARLSFHTHFPAGDKTFRL